MNSLKGRIKKLETAEAPPGPKVSAFDLMRDAINDWRAARGLIAVEVSRANLTDLLRQLPYDRLLALYRSSLNAGGGDG